MDVIHFRNADVWRAAIEKKRKRAAVDVTSDLYSPNTLDCLHSMHELATAKDCLPALGEQCSFACGIVDGVADAIKDPALKEV